MLLWNPGVTFGNAKLWKLLGLRLLPSAVGGDGNILLSNKDSVV